MGRKIGKTISLTVEANISPCAHTCRYCSIGDRSSPVDIDRYLAFVDRLMEWAKSRQNGLKVQTGFLPSYECDLDTFQTFGRWSEKTHSHGIKWIPLGGLKMRGDDEMHRWLAERQEHGLIGVGATLVGHGAVHDRWNGRRGDFDFLMQTIRTGIDLGLEYAYQHLLIKDTLPLLSESISTFDGLPKSDSGKSARLPYFIGHNVHHEAQRLDEGDRSELPAFVTDLLQPSIVLRSEREWTDLIQLEEEEPINLILRLELDAKNISQLEMLPCEEIFSDLESRAKETLSKIPSIQELAKTHSDPENTRLYTFAGDMDRRWIHRFLQAHPMDVDYKLLHYHLGGSFRPPRLWDLAGAQS